MTPPPTDPIDHNHGLPGAAGRRLRPWHRWRRWQRRRRSGGQVALRMSTWGNDSRLKLTEEAVTAFEQANPGITVQVENSEFSSYWDKLATQTAGNNAPDVIQMDESYIAAYGGRGALLDLGTQSSVLDLSAMDAKVLDTGKVNDTLVGAPVGVALFSVGVNPELLKRPA